MRGDRPLFPHVKTQAGKFTPHARGSTAHSLSFLIISLVYPACAGIDLVSLEPRVVLMGLPRMRGDRPHRVVEIHVIGGLPRMRGDRPDPVLVVLVKAEFTPHARGSTRSHTDRDGIRRVYPACAGIDLVHCFCGLQLHCLPRMRGDRPL